LKAILDTHAFLWWNLDDPRLSERARAFISDGGNEIYLSAASAWEIAIKVAKGRLTLPEAPDQYVANRMGRHRFTALPIELSHALHVYGLPQIHSDPFDRLLVAQSQMEQLPILTVDDNIARYEVEIVW
jgi:PIN domain nuclease of toxin-antitoxin system